MAGPREILTPLQHDPRVKDMVLEAGEAARRGKERCVCVIPCSMVSKLAGHVGRSLDLAQDAAGDVLNLVAPDECAADITVTITLQDNTGASRRGFATLRWGAGGHQASVDVDCSRGMSVSLFASSLRVTVTNEDTTTAVAGAFVGRGAGPSRPIRTIEVGSVVANPGALNPTTTSPIPLFARAVTVFRSDPSVPLRLQFSAPGGVNYLASVAPFDQLPWMPVPGYARLVGFFNDDPATSTSVALVYELAL